MYEYLYLNVSDNNMSVRFFYSTVLICYVKQEEAQVNVELSFSSWGKCAQYVLAWHNLRFTRNEMTMCQLALLDDANTL